MNKLYPWALWFWFCYQKPDEAEKIRLSHASRCEKFPLGNTFLQEAQMKAINANTGPDNLH